MRETIMNDEKIRMSQKRQSKSSSPKLNPSGLIASCLRQPQLQGGEGRQNRHSNVLCDSGRPAFDVLNTMQRLTDLPLASPLQVGARRESDDLCGPFDATFGERVGGRTGHADSAYQPADASAKPKGAMWIFDEPRSIEAAHALSLIRLERRPENNEHLLAFCHCRSLARANLGFKS